MSMNEDMLRRMQADDLRLRQTETKEVPIGGGGSGASCALWASAVTNATIAANGSAHVDFDYPLVSTGVLTTGASWTWAPASAGVYLVSVSVLLGRLSVNWSSGDSFDMYLMQYDGAFERFYANLDNLLILGGLSNNKSVQGTAMVYASPTNYIFVQIDNNSSNDHEIIGDGDSAGSLQYTTNAPGSTHIEIIPISV